MNTEEDRPRRKRTTRALRARPQGINRRGLLAARPEREMSGLYYGHAPTGSPPAMLARTRTDEGAILR